MSKSQKIRIAIIISIIVILDIAVIGLLLYEIFAQGKINASSIGRTVIILLSSIIAFAKLMIGRTGSHHSSDFYRRQYEDMIGTAFTTDKELEKRFFKGIEAFNHDRNDRAIKIFEKMTPELRVTDDRFAVLVFTALCYTELGALRHATEIYEQAMLLKGNSTVASNLGLCYQKLGDFDNALKSYETAIEIDPKNAFPYNNIAQLLINEEEYEDALEYAQAATKIKANFYQAFNAQAICHAMLGNKQEYESALRRAVSCGSNKEKLIAYIRNLDAPIFRE